MVDNYGQGLLRSRAVAGALYSFVSFEEQIMSKNKYPSIFSPQMETVVFFFLQIFFATRAVLKIGDI